MVNYSIIYGWATNLLQKLDSKYKYLQYDETYHTTHNMISFIAEKANKDIPFREALYLYISGKKSTIYLRDNIITFAGYDINYLPYFNGFDLIDTLNAK